MRLLLFSSSSRLQQKLIQVEQQYSDCRCQVECRQETTDDNIGRQCAPAAAGRSQTDASFQIQRVLPARDGEAGRKQTHMAHTKFTVSCLRGHKID